MSKRQDFPSGSEFRTVCFHCRGATASILGRGGGSVGTKIPQAPARGPQREGRSVSALILASETCVGL